MHQQTTVNYYLGLIVSAGRTAQLSDASIIMDASEYIKELKQKVVRLKQEMACEEEEEEAGALLKHSSSPSPTV